MSVTDLTNTIWIFNDTLNYNSDTSWSINFTSNNTNFTILDIEFDAGIKLSYYNSQSGFVRAYYDGDWRNTNYKTIQITGGGDVTNSSLINYLQNNAKQVPSDLTNTTWLINSTPTINPPNIALTHITYTTNNVQCTSMFIGYIPELDTENEIWYYNPNATGDAYFCAYSTQTGWSNQAYRTITITGGTDVTNSNFILWLQNNATQQETPTPTPTPISTGKIGDLPIIKKHFGSLEIIKEVLNGSVIYESSPQPTQSYSVTFTASNYWSYSDDWSHVYIYDGTDNTGTLLLHQHPANKSAFPMTLTITSGHCYIELEGAFVNEAYVTSNDFNVQTISSNLQFLLTIDGDGTADISINTFDE